MKGTKLSQTVRILCALIVLTGTAYLAADTLSARLDTWLIQRANQSLPRSKGRVLGLAQEQKASADANKSANFAVISKR